MTIGTVYKAGWTLDDVSWDLFDPAAVDPSLLAAVKAAALVEYNAPDYVIYLKRIFNSAGAETLGAIDQWGKEESQHGKALAHWAQLADPSFDLEQTFARFRKGYQPDHFKNEDATSIRGSRRGEMIARCVVESGTSSYYSAVRDFTEEPVLKEVAGRIAADEYRHYKLFYDTLHAQNEPELSFWRKLLVAIGRVNESDDDELAYACYCASVPPEREAVEPYSRKKYSRIAYQRSLMVYRRRHIDKLAQMVSKAIGAQPHGKLSRWAGALLWRVMRMRAGTRRNAEAAA
jgi:rubrerythrin